MYFGMPNMQLGHREILFDRKLCYNCWEGDAMKIKEEQDSSCKEIEVTIKYPRKCRQIDRIIDLLQSVDLQIKCDIENEERMINV